MANRCLALGAVCAALATPAHAHPHVFIDASIEVVFDDLGRAAALRIDWAYDDFYSLTYLSENGFDPDYDEVLTPEEQSRLSGFDMGWDADFPGDTYALLGERPLALSRPSDFAAIYKDGRIISTHLRSLSEPVALTGEDLVVQVYDPSFYTAYRIGATPVLTGATATCTVQVLVPDREAADEILLAAIEELAGGDGAEGEFPAIGSAYAEEARIMCPAP